MTNNTHENKLKYDLSLVGIGELMKAPIKATLSSLDFPNITLELQQNNDGTPFYNGTLWLDIDDFITVEMAGASAFKEALAIIAYHQQETNTPLRIDDEVADSVRYFYEHSQYSERVNPLIEHNTGREITLEMMSKANREKVDLLFAEKRINGGKK